MEKNKKMLFLMIIMVGWFLFFGRSNKNQEETIPSYKIGTFYEKIVVKKGNFLSNLLSRFKKEVPTTLSDADILKITYASDKIEKIEIVQANLLQGKEESAQKLFDKIIEKQKFDLKELEISEDIKEISNSLIDAIVASKNKSISSNTKKEKGKTYKLGTFSAIVLNEEADKFMEVTLNTSDIGITKIVVSQEKMDEKGNEDIKKIIESILNNKIDTLETGFSSSPAYEAFVKGANQILDQMGMETFSKIIKKSNPVWQGVKDAIAGIINLTYKGVKNYGVAIIVATIIIKIILLPLTLKQDKSMKEMKKVQPLLEKVKEQYKNDPQMMNQKTMELYKEHKINPAGGCLPLLVQMPILIALFGVLRSGIIPEHGNVINEVLNFNGNIAINYIKGILNGPGFLWLDLVTPDQFYILPVLTGIVTYLQQKAMGSGGSGAEDNPMMKNMSTIMPIFMVFIALNMPSGVQLYWLISTALAVVQQRWIMKKGE
ncbi:YidC/Oxa1 family membrane protein insertase [Fusobacterium sp. PH5-44]